MNNLLNVLFRKRRVSQVGCCGIHAWEMKGLESERFSDVDRNVHIAIRLTRQEGQQSFRFHSLALIPITHRQSQLQDLFQSRLGCQDSQADDKLVSILQGISVTRAPHGKEQVEDLLIRLLPNFGNSHGLVKGSSRQSSLSLDLDSNE